MTDTTAAKPAAKAAGFLVILALSFSYMLNDVMQSLLAAIYPMLKTDFQLDFWQIGLLTMAFQVTASLLQPAVGLYTDRKPLPYSLAFGMGSTFCGLILLAYAGQYALLIAGAALIGFGSAIFHPESSRIARMASGGRFGMAQSVFQIGGNVGTAIGPLLAAFIVVPYGQASVAWFSVIAQIGIPPTETSFTRYLPQIPAETEVIYHVMVGPAVLTFVKELGEFYGSGPRPEIFGFIDSLEAVDVGSPGLEFLEGSHFWEGMCRYTQPDETEAQKAYRAAVGVDDNGASVTDAKEVSTYAHMFSVWETLFAVKAGMEAAGYQGPDDRQKFVEAMEAIAAFDEGAEHPQGPKVFNGKTHQAFGLQSISKVEGGKLKRVHQTTMEDGFYPDEVDYTTMSF